MLHNEDIETGKEGCEMKNKIEWAREHFNFIFLAIVWIIAIFRMLTE